MGGIKGSYSETFEYECEESSEGLATSAQIWRLWTQSKSRNILTRVGTRLQVLWKEGYQKSLSNRDR